MKSLALEFGPLGVRVNGIAPTAVDTPFLRATYERIGVVVHPQSLIHSLIHLNDGSSLAHLGYPCDNGPGACREP